MLTIRLTRKGKKNQPFFSIVVIDKKRSSTGGRAVEILGYVDPLTKRKSIKKERILHWIKNGAKPSPTVHNLLVSEKIIDAKKVAVKIKKSKEPAAAAPTAPTAPVAEAPKPAEEKPEEKKLASAEAKEEKPAENPPAPEQPKA